MKFMGCGKTLNYIQSIVYLRKFRAANVSEKTVSQQLLTSHFSSLFDLIDI